MPSYTLSSALLYALLAPLDRMAVGLHKAETDLVAAGSSMEDAFTTGGLFATNLDLLAALGQSGSNFKAAGENVNAQVSSLASEFLGRLGAVIPYAGLGSGVLTVEQALSSFNQGVAIVIPMGPGFRLVQEAVGAIDLKRWNYVYPTVPSSGNYLGRSLLGVFGAGNVTIDQTKYRGSKDVLIYPTVYGGTPYTPVITCTIYDPATDTFVANKTYTTAAPIAVGSSVYAATVALVPGGGTPGPAGAEIVSIQNITGVHAASSLYVGGSGGTGTWV